MKKQYCFYGSDVNLLSASVVYYDAYIKRKDVLSQEDIQELDVLTHLEENSCFKQPFAFDVDHAPFVLRALCSYSRHCDIHYYYLADKCNSLVLIIEDMLEHESE